MKFAKNFTHQACKSLKCFQGNAGITFCVRRQALESPYMAWKLFIDESIFR